MKEYNSAETPFNEPQGLPGTDERNRSLPSSPGERHRSLQEQIDELRGQFGNSAFTDSSGIRVGSYRRQGQGMHNAPETQAEYLAEWLETHYGLQMDPGRRQVLLSELAAFLDGSYPAEIGAERLDDPRSRVADALQPAVAPLTDPGPQPGPLAGYVQPGPLAGYDETGLLVRPMVQGPGRIQPNFPGSKPPKR